MTPQGLIERTKAYRFVLSENSGSGEAVCARVGVRDDYGDRFLPGSFDSDVGKVVPLLAAHSVGPAPPLGTIMVTGEVGTNVRAEFALNETSLAQEWRTAAKTHGVELSVRVRFNRADVDEVELGQGRIGWDIRKVKVREISLAGLGAQPGTGTSRVKSDTLDEEPVMLFKHRSLAAMSLNRRTLNGGQR